MSNYRIKNWPKFQQYKNRRPPWIRLYRDLLDDVEWFNLDPKDAKYLVSLWLMAAEDETMLGILPSDSQVCHRLRITNKQLLALYTRLEHWLERDASTMLADCKQVDTPETDQNRSETEKEQCVDFEEFWKIYPEKQEKPTTKSVWNEKRIGYIPDILVLIQKHLSKREQLKKSSKVFVPNLPHPKRYLKNRRWEDEISTSPPIPKGCGNCDRGVIYPEGISTACSCELGQHAKRKEAAKNV